MASGALSAALEDAERVVKKQRTCETRTDELLDQLISMVLATKAQLETEGAQQQQQQPAAGALAALQQQVQKLGIEKEMNSQTKELHAAVGKLGKVRNVRAPRLRVWRRACAQCSGAKQQRAFLFALRSLNPLATAPHSHLHLLDDCAFSSGTMCSHL